MKKDNKGFSLVELIIVIAIMAILVVVVAPQYLKYVEKSRVSVDQDNAGEIGRAFQIYAADKGNPDADVTFTITTSGIPAASTNTWADAAIANAGLHAGDAKIKSKNASWKTSYDVKFSKEGVLSFAPADIVNSDYDPSAPTASP